MGLAGEFVNRTERGALSRKKIAKFLADSFRLFRIIRPFRTGAKALVQKVIGKKLAVVVRGNAAGGRLHHEPGHGGAKLTPASALLMSAKSFVFRVTNMKPFSRVEVAIRQSLRKLLVKPPALFDLLSMRRVIIRAASTQEE